jgi:hypothetical protein
MAYLEKRGKRFRVTLIERFGDSYAEMRLWAALCPLVALGRMREFTQWKCCNETVDGNRLST